MNTGGRPRSEEARLAVLHAVDDLLLEVGYSAMTMKSIADRAKVSRATVYRWWSTKAEVLFEASTLDSAKELAVGASGDPRADLVAYLDALAAFLARSPAGIAYRVLLTEAQSDAAVAELVRSRDVLGDTARLVLERALPGAVDDQVVASFIGPVFFWVASGRGGLDSRELVEAFLRSVR
ncbi:TetR/AcrR family transcriptional regulator [Lentzea sp. HUAS12]|uniref:TetR/AcrR family transcriptional regulator n=1 Tax=Lentzea sp. HUAS12 TaxID=2951806 RepID=UPI00209E3F21|nr:TetR/AcrR family transcriptional regulator [Lentzea sp. HUAS12]USX52803.1 TetR/AcrR family transcriptional regulator [Lentzea sp. HUAS12]